MKPLLKQLKNRRLTLGLKQNDMLLRVGISRHQYQHLESKGTPRLDTLELVAQGLNSEMLLIPKDKLNAVLAVLEDRVSVSVNSDLSEKPHIAQSKQQKNLVDDPWQDILGDIA